MSKIISASKLSRFWKNGILPIKDKVDNPISTYSDLMANTVEGYSVDPLAVKEGFNDTNSRLNSILNFRTAYVTDISVDLTNQWAEVWSHAPEDGYGTYFVIVQILVPKLDSDTMVTVAPNSMIAQSNTATILANNNLRRIQAMGYIPITPSYPELKINAWTYPTYFTCTEARIIYAKVK